jgi:uncharacterized protein YxjI
MFRDRFFSSGETEIFSESREMLGTLDLRSAFTSSVDVYDQTGAIRCIGRFPMLSYKWEVTGPHGETLGHLRERMTFFSKKFTYETDGRGDYDIVSPAFSKEYEIFDMQEQLVARFEQTSSWFESEAYCLDNQSPRLDDYELVAVIMGMHEMQQRHHHN